MGTLAGGIAHDFNNILTAIVGNAEMAQIELPPNHTGRQDIAEVQRATRRARDLVPQILTFSRKQQPERRPVRVADVIDDVVRLLRATIPVDDRPTLAKPIHERADLRRADAVASGADEPGDECRARHRASSTG